MDAALGRAGAPEAKSTPSTISTYFRKSAGATQPTKPTAAVDDFAAAGAVILGVSKDPVKKHDKFIAKHELKIALLSDEESDMCERYGVWVEKNMYGKTYMGIERATFLIGADGKIAKVWPKVKVPGHAEAVLEAVKAL